MKYVSLVPYVTAICLQHRCPCDIMSLDFSTFNLSARCKSLWMRAAAELLKC